MDFSRGRSGASGPGHANGVDVGRIAADSIDRRYRKGNAGEKATAESSLPAEEHVAAI